MTEYQDFLSLLSFFSLIDLLLSGEESFFSQEVNPSVSHSEITMATVYPCAKHSLLDKVIHQTEELAQSDPLTTHT